MLQQQQQPPYSGFQGGGGSGGSCLKPVSSLPIPIQAATVATAAQQVPQQLSPHGQPFVQQQAQFMTNSPSPPPLRLEVIKDGIENRKFFTKDTKSESQTHVLAKIHGYGSIQVASLTFDAYAVRLDDTPISKDRKEKKSYVKVGETRFVESESWDITLKMTEGTLKSLAKFYITAKLTFNNGKTIELKSNPSSAFITITNANQKKNALQIFCHYSFFRQSKDGLSAVSVNDFTSNLQAYFNSQINKDPQYNVRKLVPYEIDSMMMRFFPGQTRIEPGQQFTNFFHWLDGTIAVLQTPGPRVLLECGYIFVSIVDPLLEFILLRQQVGTFLIRCSETTPGKLSVVYRSGEKSFGKLWLGNDLSPAAFASALNVAPMLTKIARIDTHTQDVVIYSKEYVVRGFCTHNSIIVNPANAEQDGIPIGYCGSIK